jgi:hypothetical protein
MMFTGFLVVFLVQEEMSLPCTGRKWKRKGCTFQRTSYLDCSFIIDSGMKFQIVREECDRERRIASR